MKAGRIAFLPSVSRYEVLWEFLKQLHDAFKDIPEVRTHLFDVSISARDFYAEFCTFKPELIVAFNSLFTHEDGRLLCDHLYTPTLFCLVDAPFHFNVVSTPLAWISCIDRGHLRYLEKRGIERCFFLPHAIDRLEAMEDREERGLGCVMLSSGIDYEAIFEELQGFVSKKCFLKIEEGLERWEADRALALDDALEEELPTSVSRNVILHKLDLYLKGRKRVELLKSLTEFQVDLFGGGDSWEKILGSSCPHVRVHPEVHYTEAAAIISHSKVVINSCASIRDGLHERILLALSRGAAVVTEGTPYLHETFGKGSGIAYYPKYSEMKQQLALWLQDEQSRCAAVEEGRRRIEEAHLWKHRAQTIHDTVSVNTGIYT